MISVIIVNYHSAADTLRAVASLVPPAQEEETEIWVVDNSVSSTEERLLREHLDPGCLFQRGHQCQSRYDGSPGRLE